MLRIVRCVAGASTASVSIDADFVGVSRISHLPVVFWTDNESNHPWGTACLSACLSCVCVFTSAEQRSSAFWVVCPGSSQAREKKQAERAARDARDDFERGFGGGDGPIGTRLPGEWEPSNGARTAPTIGQVTMDPEDEQAEQFHESLNEREDSVEYFEDEQGDEVYVDGEEIERDIDNVDGMQQQQQQQQQQQHEEGSSFMIATQQVAEDDYVGVVGA